jgi:hypothetical protein
MRNLSKTPNFKGFSIVGVGVTKVSAWNPFREVVFDGQILILGQTNSIQV